MTSWSRTGTIKLCEVATVPVWATLTGHQNWVCSVAFSPDGRSLASGSRDNTIKLWHVAAGQVGATLTGHQSTVWSVAFSPDGRSLASGSGDNTIKLWDVATGQVRATLTGHQNPVASVAFSPDGRSLASGSGDNTIKLWGVESVVNFRLDLAGYLASGWCTLDGRKLLCTGTTDNLYKSRVSEYVNVPPFSHIGILQRKLPAPELEKTLFWGSLDANNWDSAMVLYEQLTIPEARESAREALI